MSFKDIVREDIRNVFFNLDEFAEGHMIGGRKMVCIIDQDANAAAAVRSVMGVYSANRRIYVKEEDLKVLPEEGSRLNLDGQFFFVTDAWVEMGVFVIELQANRA